MDINNLKVGDLIPIGGSGCVKSNEVLEGKTFSNDDGTDLVGTMKNMGRVSFVCSENDQVNNNNGYYSQINIQGLNSMNEGEIEKIIDNTIKNNGRPRVSLANKIVENFRKNISDFSTTKHVAVEYKYNQNGWFREEIPFNSTININSCIALIKIEQSGNIATRILYSLNKQAELHNNEEKDFIDYAKYEYDKILNNSPALFFRNTQTTKMNTTFLRVMLQEQSNTYTEIFFDIYNDKLSLGTTENKAEKYKNDFKITFDIFEI